MPTIKDIISAIEVEQEQTTKRYERATTEINMILAKAKNEGRANLTTDEDRDIDQAFITRDASRTDLKGIENKMARAKKVEAEEAETDLSLRERGAPPTNLTASDSRPAYDRVARVGNEERTYNKRADRDGGAFIRDVTRQFLYRDMESEQRLLRHMQEERVERGQYLTRAAGDATTGAFGGLTVPQYLTDMYAPATAALRPFADQCNKHSLPASGMVVNISQITTATSAALQATELSGVSATSIDDTVLSANVQTAAGAQLLSRQAIDRGTGVEEVVMDDLFRRYATVLDSTLINQASTGLEAIAAGQTHSTAGGATTYAQMVKAQSTVETTLLGFAQPDLAIMHPRRFYSMASTLDSKWPMLFGNNPIEVQGVNAQLGYAKGIRGTLANGLQLCVDANVSVLCNATAATGGTQDHIFVVPSQEMHLWEDPSAPVFIRAEQPFATSLGVQIVLYGYFAYVFNRFPSGATVKINGAGLAAPGFAGDGV